MRKYSNAIHRDRQIIIQRYRGEVGINDVIDACHDLWAAPNYDRSFHGISDFTQCSPVANMADLKAIGQFLSENPHTTTARWVLITQNPVLTAFGYLFNNSAFKPNLQICSTWEGACTYLQIDPAIHN